MDAASVKAGDRWKGRLFFRTCGVPDLRGSIYFKAFSLQSYVLCVALGVAAIVCYVKHSTSSIPIVQIIKIFVFPVTRLPLLVNSLLFFPPAHIRCEVKCCTYKYCCTSTFAWALVGRLNATLSELWRSQDGQSSIKKTIRVPCWEEHNSLKSHIMLNKMLYKYLLVQEVLLVRTLCLFISRVRSSAQHPTMAKS